MSTRRRRHRRRRVAIVAAGADIIGGHSNQAALLGAALAGDGLDVVQVRINPRLHWSLAWIRRIPVVRTLVNEVLYACGLLRLTRVDVAHVFSASYWSFLLAPVPAMLVARCAGARVVLHYHSGEVADHLDHWGWRVHPWLRLAHEIVCCSEFQQRVFARHGYRTTVIPNLVDPEALPFSARWPIAPTLLSNRHLERPYGVDLVLEAFSWIRADRPEATLVIAGAGSDETRLRQIAARIGMKGIMFLGPVQPDRMAWLLGRHDVLLNGSAVDNQPVSLLEAMAAGTVVVSTPTGGIPEIIDDRRTGVLVERDPRAMARAVLALLDAPPAAAAMIRHAHEAVVSRHTWPAIRDRWAAVYGLGVPTFVPYGYANVDSAHAARAHR